MNKIRGLKPLICQTFVILLIQPPLVALAFRSERLSRITAEKAGRRIRRLSLILQFAYFVDNSGKLTGKEKNR